MLIALVLATVFLAGFWFGQKWDVVVAAVNSLISRGLRAVRPDGR